MQCLMPCTLVLYTDLSDLIFFPTLFIEVYKQRNFYLKEATSFFSDSPRCYSVAYLYESCGVRITTVLEIIVFKHISGATVLIQIEVHLLHNIKVSRAAFLPPQILPS